MSTPLLSLRSVGKTFSVGTGLRRKSLRALSDVSLDLHAGEIIAIVGESGSGKSTILKILSRLEAPSRGEIWFEGENLLSKEPQRASLQYRQKVQMIFQDPFGSLNPLKTVGHHLERPLLRHGRATRGRDLEQKVEALLEQVGLRPGADFAPKYPHMMSGGQRQRVAIARALSPMPRLILADEPISMLDVSIRLGILNLLADLRDTHGLSYLYVTHDIGSARYLADRTVVMYAGHMVEGGLSEELLSAPAHPYTKLLLAAVPEPGQSISRALPGKSGAPRLVDPPPGCPFADRCPEVMDRCRRDNPKPIQLKRRGDSEGRFVRCHLHDPALVSAGATGSD